MWRAGCWEWCKTSNCSSSWSEETNTISRRLLDVLIASYACFSRGVNCLHGGHLQALTTVIKGYRQHTGSLQSADSS